MLFWHRYASMSATYSHYVPRRQRPSALSKPSEPVRSDASIFRYNCRWFTSVLVVRVERVGDDSHRDTHRDWPETTLARHRGSNDRDTHSGDHADKKSVRHPREGTHSVIQSAVQMSERVHTSVHQRREYTIPVRSAFPVFIGWFDRERVEINEPAVLTVTSGSVTLILAELDQFEPRVLHTRCESVKLQWRGEPSL